MTSKLTEQLLNKTPQLNLSFDRKFWLLIVTHEDTPGVESTTLELRIRHEWDGQTWDHYDRYIWRAGVDYEVLTWEEKVARDVAIIDHEGPGAAMCWLMCNHVTWPGRHEGIGYYIPVFEALKRRWEAMINLKLFNPAVTR